MNENIEIKTMSGLRVSLSQNAYEKYCDFDFPQAPLFDSCVEGSVYFPQIIQFIAIMYSICTGHASLKDILVASLLYTVCYCLLWRWLKLYKIPLLPSICSLLGKSVFRFFIPFIPVIVVSLYVLKDWRVILYCVISWLITFLVRTLLNTRLMSVKYTDGIIYYVCNQNK